jgi:hypothetical protein
VSGESEPGSYGLVFPFIVCASQGGPYDDQAFVAGARFGALTARAEAGEPRIESYEAPAMVPQIDLLAMHYGYVLAVEPWEVAPDEWVRVVLTQTATPPGVCPNHYDDGENFCPNCDLEYRTTPPPAEEAER